MTVIILEATGSHMQQVHFIQAWHKPFTFSGVSLSQKRNSDVDGLFVTLALGSQEVSYH